MCWMCPSSLPELGRSLPLECRGKTDETARMCMLIWIFTDCTYEPPHDKTNKMIRTPSEDSDQPGHPPSLIRAFAVHIKTPWVLSYPLSTQRRLWSDCTDAQANLSLWWVHCMLVLSCCSSNGPGRAKTCLMPYANNKSADQPALVRFLDSIISLVSRSEISRF